MIFEGTHIINSRKGIPYPSQMSFYDFLLSLQKEITVSGEDIHDLPANQFEYSKISAHYCGDYRVETEKPSAGETSKPGTVVGNVGWMDLAA